MFRKFGLHAVLIIACVVIIVFPMLREKPDTEKAEKATAAATEFLALLDKADYDRSWQVAAALLKDKVTQDEWVEQLTKMYSVSGPLSERALGKSTFTTSAKDAPDGEYITLQYNSSFQNNKDTNETVIVMLEEDQAWRVAGYYIQ